MVNVRVPKDSYELLKTARELLGKRYPWVKHLSLGAFVGCMIDYLKENNKI